jgi:hypothetical protein
VRVRQRGTRAVRTVRIRGRGRVRYTVRCGRRPGQGKPKPIAAPAETFVRVRSEVFAPGSPLYVEVGSRDQEVSPAYSRPVLTDELPGWQDVAIEVRLRGTFSADFSRVLFTGRRSPDGSRHVGVLDLATGKAVDLTAPRQGSGFTDPVLCESQPVFAGAVSGTLGLTGTVVVEDSCERYRDGSELAIDPADPSSAQPITEEQADAMRSSASLAANTDGSWGIIAPADRRYYQGEPFPLMRSADGRVLDAACLFDQGGSVSVERVWWTGPRTAVAILEEGDFRVLTIEGEASLGCSGGIPASDRNVFGTVLSFDLSRVLFRADGPDGTESYAVSLSTGAIEPYEWSALGLNPVFHALYQLGPTR